MDKGDRGFFGGRDRSALAEKVDLVVSVDPAFQMQSQMQVQQGSGRAGTRGGAFFPPGFFPSGVWA